MTGRFRVAIRRAVDHELCRSRWVSWHALGVNTHGELGGGLQPGNELLLRYLYNDGSVQAAMPMRVVLDDRDLTVAWLAPATPIMYWASNAGGDPRESPLNERFKQPLTTAARSWTGPGVLRVMPAGRPYQVVHFWDDEHVFAGWYVNFEAPRIRKGARLDTVDWHLDLWISPDRQPSWKDEVEAEAALGTDHLRASDLKIARAAGQSIIDHLQGWPKHIGDWRSFRPDPTWDIPMLPSNWSDRA